MIDSNEPKNGDFVTYVEKLVRLPPGARLPAQGASPGEVTSDRPNRGRLAQMIRTSVARAGDAGGRAQSATAAQSARTAEGTSAASAWGHGGGRPAAYVEQAAREVVRTVARVLGRVATVMLVVGIGLVAIAFADDPPFRVDPMVGVILAVAGGLIKRLAGKAVRVA